jgi:uncharacterized membrane protein YphA (DoxX/SURF4 family)
VSESERLAAATAALEGAFEEARPHMMRWSVVTIALRDLIRAKTQIELNWVEIAQVATRWVEDLRAKGYSMAPGPASPQRTQSNASSLRPPSDAARTTDVPRTWIERNGLRTVGLAIGIVFVWFGLMKPLGQSAVADVVTKSLPFAPPTLALHVAGWWEVATGVCLLVPRLARAAVVLLAAQLPALLLPFLLAPDACFVHAPYALTVAGESLIKSLLLTAAAVVVVRSAAR